MEKGDQVEKIKLEAEGEAIEGLVQLDEYVIEDDKVDVPGLDKIVGVRTGVMKIPEIGAVFKIKKNSRTLKFIQDWYYKKQVKNMTVIKTDGAGKEITRELWQNVEVRKCHGAAYDAASPIFAQIKTTFLPEDIIPIAAEG
jgi:hypothetical protein